MKAIATKVGVDPEIVNAASPTKASPAKAKYVADQKAVDALGKEYHDRIYQVTSDFVKEQPEFNQTINNPRADVCVSKPGILM